MVLDGEILAKGDNDNSDFSKLALRSHLGDKTSDRAKELIMPLEYHVFDVLSVMGENVCHLPLDERRKLLVQSVDENSNLKVVKQHPRGIDLFEQMVKEGQEGIVSKRRDGSYEPGKRHWIKVKVMCQDEFVVGGITMGEGKREGKVGALLIGALNASGEFSYFGKVGTGFSDSMLDVIWRKLDFDQDENPFVGGGWDRKIELEEPVFVVPEMVIQTRYQAISKDGRLRFPSFLGFRDDKEASEVVAPNVD